MNAPSAFLGLAETLAEARGIPFPEQGLAYRRRALACGRAVELSEKNQNKSDPPLPLASS